MLVSLTLILALSPLLAFSYNVDTSHPIVYKDQESGGNGYFGYTVTLRSGQNSAASASIFIGAPEYMKGEGALYRCSINDDKTPSGTCRRLNIDQASVSGEIRVRNLPSLKIVQVGTVGWLGASLATRDYSDLTVCAPRSLFKYVADDGDESFTQGLVDDMRGICYTLPEAIGDTLYRDNSVLPPDEHLLQSINLNALHGFSINYAAKKVSNTVELIIGRPRLNKVEIHHENKTEVRVYPGLGPGNLDRILAKAAEGANLGYSVTSGYFFRPQELVFAAGTPAWNFTGQVVVYLPGTVWETKIDGSVLGEYFGASLATGDFDNDGLDDIAVGAPHWGEVDYGRVYTFYGNNKGVFREGLMLQGTSEYGQFGYTLAASDLDGDGYADLVVGAPWEASGAVYVFYGQREFGTKEGCTPIKQRISPSEFKSSVTIQRFGFSLALPVDVDNNGYPDLAVGAYKSGHAILLRSKPVVKLTPRLVSYSPILDRSARSFVIGVCAEYHGKGAPESQVLSIEIAVDEEYTRIENDESMKLFTTPFSPDEISTCVNRTLYLVRGFKNFLEPIVIRGRFSISNKSRQGDKFCSHCPVLNKGHMLGEAELFVPFNTGCKDGKVCNSNLSISWMATGVSNNDQWVVGSGDVNIDIRVTNNGEPAFQTEIMIKMPPGVRLRKAIPSCVETKEGNSVVLECDVGNPLFKGEPKSLAVDLDMGGIASSAGSTILRFTVTTKTWSVDRGEKKSVFCLRLENRAHITLTGVANEQNHEYGKTGNNTKLSIRHTYQLTKKGPSSLPKVHFAVDVPVAITDKNVSIVHIYLPELDSSGNMHECSIVDTVEYRKSILPKLLNPLQPMKSRGIPELNSEEKKEEQEVDATDEEIYSGEKKNEMFQERKTSIDGQGTDRTIYVNCSTAGITCRTVMCDFNISKTSGDVGNSILDMIFDVQPLFTPDEKSFTVNFSTDARALIIEPILLDTMNGSRFVTAKASTMLYNVPEAQELSGWVLPVSIGFGLLLLVFLIIILLKVGFFNRPNKTRTAKTKEMRLKLNGDDGYSELDLYG
ncbi:integrin alpha-9-like [Diprion similis]|uniref:integrin alpha-9-like n=1 Tax=Diprion similis TaxID=362088 RepID=UPI001EF991A4|nr:integrin alpha-9-like [Diprion similis]